MFQQDKNYLYISTKTIFLFLSSLLAIRLVTLGLYDMIGTTEARYSAVAFRMLQYNDFITPYYYNKIPFLGKSPLAFWASALSFKFFGINNFAARLPHFLAFILQIIFIYKAVEASPRFKLIMITILATFFATFVIYGSMMLESFLMLSCTIILLSFYRVCVLKTSSKFYGYMFFVGIALTLLAKGLTGALFCGASIFLYLLITKEWRSLTKLPWFIGTILSICIFLPWYILCEIKNTGFLQYFIFVEHFARFFVAGWQDGHNYGKVHASPLFTIWFYLFMGAMPWSVYLVGILFKNKFFIKCSLLSNQVILFFLIAFFTPLIILSFAKHLLLTYSVFAYMPLAFLLTSYITKKGVISKVIFIYFGFILVLSVVAAILNIMFYYNTADKAIAQKFLQERGNPNEKLILWGKQTFPREFYTQDNIIKAKDIPAIFTLLQQNNWHYVAISNKDIPLLGTSHNFTQITCAKIFYLIKQDKKNSSQEFCLLYFAAK